MGTMGARHLLILAAVLIAGMLGGACAKTPSFSKKEGRSFFIVPRHVPNGSLTEDQVAGLKAWEDWLIEEAGGRERLGSEIEGWETVPHFEEDRKYIIVMYSGDMDVFHEALFKFMGGEFEEQEVTIEP